MTNEMVLQIMKEMEFITDELLRQSKDMQANIDKLQMLGEKLKQL